jgi:hypothetical protein
LSNLSSYKYYYDPALADDEPTFNYDDEIDLLSKENFTTLNNETKESFIYEGYRPSRFR